MSKTSESKPKTGMEILGILALGGIKTLLMIGWTFYEGWVLMTVWAWFAVAMLGLPALAFPGAIAVVILKGTLMTRTSDLNMLIAANEKLSKDMKTFLDWAGQPMLSTIMLVGGALWRFVILPLFGVI